MFRRQGIYMGWVGRRNLGDEAIFHACQSRFSSIAWHPLEQLAYTVNVASFAARGSREPGYLWRTLADELRTQRRLRSYGSRSSHKLSAAVAGEVAILGGGTILNRAGPGSYLTIRKRVGSPIPTFGTGVAQPRFWSRMSDWMDRRKEWAAALDELPVIGVRGPQSKALLEDAGARNVVVCGDPAIVFHRPIDHAAARTGPKLRIAFNTGDCSGFLWGSMEPVQDALAGAARQLAADGHEVRVVPIWPKDLAASRDLVQRAELPGDSLLPVLDEEGPFLQAMATFDVMIAFKLHAGVLAAVANVPFILLEYQPKAYDFASSIGCEDLTIRTDEVTRSRLLEKFEMLAAGLPARQRATCASLCALKDRFEAYCQQIEPLLYR